MRSTVVNFKKSVIHIRLTSATDNNALSGRNPWHHLLIVQGVTRDPITQRCILVLTMERVSSLLRRLQASGGLWDRSCAWKIHCQSDVSIWFTIILNRSANNSICWTNLPVMFLLFIVNLFKTQERKKKKIFINLHRHRVIDYFYIICIFCPTHPLAHQCTCQLRNSTQLHASPSSLLGFMAHLLAELMYHSLDVCEVCQWIRRRNWIWIGLSTQCRVSGLSTWYRVGGRGDLGEETRA